MGKQMETKREHLRTAETKGRIGVIASVDSWEIRAMQTRRVFECRS